MKLEGGATESPDLRFLNHFIALNLGDEVECDVRIEDGPWFPHRLGHHFFIFIPAGVQHTARRLPYKVLLIEIGAQFADQMLRSYGESAALHPLVAMEDPVVTHILLALADEAHGDGALEQVHTEALGTALLTRLVLHSASAPSPQPMGGLPSARLHRVLDHVVSHLDAPPSLRCLADLAGMDLYRFVRAFKQSTGLSPHRYVLDARIAQSKELLRDRTLSITEIALRTGFATPSHFSVTFRRVTDMTPRAFRLALPL